jgi:NAD(P)-dependent dehydrogenase (short-subunit alcohol dehydrogenase family)
MSTPFSLTGQRVLVTGASSGIGRATAIAAAEQGATVLATGRDEERLQQTLDALAGDGHRSVPGDLTTDAGRAAVVAGAERLSGVVHAAGALSLAPLKFLADDALPDMQAVNCDAPILLTRDLLRARALQPASSIVFIASVAPYLASVGHGAYAASKAALLAAARVLARELAGRRIRVNCICPGTVRTPMLEDHALAGAGMDDESRYPLGYGEPDDVANAAVFLLSDGARWITGTELLMDGGLLLLSGT